MKRFRITIFQLMIGIALSALIINSLLPPKVSFGPAKFTAFPAMGTFWGDVPIRIIVRVSVTNDGLLPVWYQRAMPNEFASGELASTAEILSNSNVDLEWHALPRCESVELREYGLKQSDQVKTRVKDWTGREFVITCEQIEMDSVWLKRDSLPPEIPD